MQLLAAAVGEKEKGVRTNSQVRNSAVSNEDHK